jgi:hypothetical protein
MGRLWKIIYDSPLNLWSETSSLLLVGDEMFLFDGELIIAPEGERTIFLFSSSEDVTVRGTFECVVYDAVDELEENVLQRIDRMDIMADNNDFIGVDITTSDDRILFVSNVRGFVLRGAENNAGLLPLFEE